MKIQIQEVTVAAKSDKDKEIETFEEGLRKLVGDGVRFNRFSGRTDNLTQSVARITFSESGDMQSALLTALKLLPTPDQKPK